MGDIYQPKIVIHKPIIIEASADSNNAWSVKIDKAEGGKISVGLHWGGKIEPTHEYLIDASKFWAAMDNLRGTKR